MVIHTSIERAIFNLICLWIKNWSARPEHKHGSIETTHSYMYMYLEMSSTSNILRNKFSRNFQLTTSIVNLQYHCAFNLPFHLYYNCYTEFIYRIPRLSIEDDIENNKLIENSSVVLSCLIQYFFVIPTSFRVL